MAMKINGIEIPEEAVRFEFDRLVKFYSEHMSAEDIKAQMPLLKKKACEQAIGGRLLIDEAHRRQIEVSQEEVDLRLQGFIESAGGPEKFDEMLKSQNISADLVRESIRQGRRVDMLVDEITQGVEEPTEEQMQAHFEAHRREYRRPDRVQASHILITPDSDSEQDRAVARSRVLEMRESIVEGADFADLAACHSRCPSGQQTGGSLGWVSPGMMVPEFDEALFDMAVGELSDVVETQFGFHIINMTDQEEGGDATYEDVCDRIRDFLIHAARGEAIKCFVDKLKQSAVIEED